MMNFSIFFDYFCIHRINDITRVLNIMRWGCLVSLWNKMPCYPTLSNSHSSRALWYIHLSLKFSFISFLSFFFFRFFLPFFFLSFVFILCFSSCSFPSILSFYSPNFPTMSSSWSPLSSTFSSPSLLPTHRISPSPSLLHLNSKRKTVSLLKDKEDACNGCAKPLRSHLEKISSMLQYGAILAAVEAPTAMAVTGEKMEEDFMTTLISGGIVAVLYVVVFPPIIMNWLRLRWYKRKFLETYLQFMFVFIFFPSLMLWAPFINFRKFPRDPTMKYPWSTPKDDAPLYKSRWCSLKYLYLFLVTLCLYVNKI